MARHSPHLTIAFALAALATQVADARADEAPKKTLTLEEALAQSKRSQPRLAQARATTEAARARVGQAGSGLLPQVNGNLSYALTYGKQRGFAPTATGFATTNEVGVTHQYSASLGASQLVWDFGETRGRRDAAAASAAAQAQTEASTAEQVALDVRIAYFTAQAQHALVEVAKETLANQTRHQQQIQGFVSVGTRPEIDLAQARTDVANARVQQINAENAYETAKATLNQAMGVEGPTDYDVTPTKSEPVEGEALGTEQLLTEALRARPELAALGEQVRAQELSLGATKGGFWPRLDVNAGANAGGTFSADDPTWALTAGAALKWPIYEGGLTTAQVEEANATLRGLRAQVDALRQSVRLEVEQARLGLVGARAALEASAEVVTAARERLRLAEGRYQAGVGNALELSDAQLGVTNAEAQHVQAEYNLAQSRARLTRALGRE